MFDSRTNVGVTRRFLLLKLADPLLHPLAMAAGRGRKAGKPLLKLPSLLRAALVARYEGCDGSDEDLDGHLDWHGSPCYIYIVVEAGAEV